MVSAGSYIDHLTVLSATCHIQLKVKDHQGLLVQFKLKKSTSLCKLMDAYCSRLGLQASQVRFIVNGERIAPDDTAEKLGLEDGDFIVAMEQTGAAAESDDEAISYGGSGLGSPLDEEAAEQPAAEETEEKKAATKAEPDEEPAEEAPAAAEAETLDWPAAEAAVAAWASARARTSEDKSF